MVRPLKPERAIAIAEGRSTYFTGVPCKAGHVCERTVSHRHCIECERLRKRPSSRACDPAQKREHQRRWRLKNPEKFKAGKERWRLANPQKYKAAGKRWRDKARPWLSESRRAYARAHYQRKAAAYRALKELGIEV